MTKVFFDESGQTGAHLLDPNQPYFTIGSTDFPEERAAEVIKHCFPKFKGNELKARSIFRRDNGRRAFLAFAEVVGENPSGFCGAKIDKRFSVLCKMVDNLVEPTVSASGYDFYADNYAAKFANMAHFAFANLMDRHSAGSILEAYNTFARSPTTETLEALQDQLATELASAPEGTEDFLSMMWMGADAFEQFHKLDEFEGTNDLHLTAVLQCMGFWQEHHHDGFDVIHDESTHFFKRSALWQRMTSPDAEATILTIGQKTLKMPIGVRSTTSSRSHECASLQLCDLIAGFIAFTSNPALEADESEFAQKAIDAGMGQVSIFPVEPGTDFPDGPPTPANGPDVVDRIIEAVNKGRI